MFPKTIKQAKKMGCHVFTTVRVFATTPSGICFELEFEAKEYSAVKWRKRRKVIKP